MCRPARRLALALGILGITSPRPAGAQADPLTAAVDTVLDSLVAADRFSGAVLIARGDRVLYQRALGLADRERGRAMTLDTRLEIASMTKLLTRIAILQLAQAGRLSLSDTVGWFLPGYPNPVVRSQVTVEQLLNHRSGIGSFWNAAYVARRGEVRSVDDYLALFQNDSLLFVPGTGQAYSNGGYVLLGAIIERVSGASYHEYVEERILRPAGMTRTGPYDRSAPRLSTAVGYTSQPLGAPTAGDGRLAGPSGPRPGTARSSSGDSAGPRRRILGPDGRELSPEEARDARARRAGSESPRVPNTEIQPGRSGPAGGHLSTVGDLARLARALTGYRLLDSAHTMALFGERYARGEDLRANGGGPGVNAEFSLYPSGHVVVVLSNYDPPAATEVAQYVRSLIARSVAPSRGEQADGTLRAEIETLHGEMVAAYRREPASVAGFYTDDASILGGGGRWIGREEIDRYWNGPAGGEWTLEVLEVGGSRDAPWVRGRSTLQSRSGRRMVTEYLGILKRQADGRLRFYVDMFVAAGSPAAGDPR